MSLRRASLFVACLLSVPLSGTLTAADGPVRTDAHGDPLPPGALLRLGTVRWRACARFLAFTPDGKTLLTGELNANHVIRCWDTATGKENAGFRLSGSPLAVALSPDGKTLAVDEPHAIVFRSIPDGKEIRRIETPAAPGANLHSTRLDFSPNGKTLAAVGNDSVVRLFEVETGKTILHLKGLDADRFPTAFSPDGKELALIGEEQTLRIVEIAGEKEVFKQEGRPGDGTLLDMSFSPDGKKIAWMGEDARTFALWDIAAGAPVLQFRGPSDVVESVRFSPDGKRVAAAYGGGEDGSIRVWDAETGKELRKFVASSRASDAAVFSPDGKRLAIAGENDGVIHLWDVETGKELRRTGEHQGLVCSAVFSPDGRTAFTACADRAVRVWNAETGAVVRRVEVGGGAGDPSNYKVAFSHDRKVVAVTDWHNHADLWDLDLGKERVRLAGGTAILWKVVFAPGDKSLASCSAGLGCLQLWDARTGKKSSRIDVDDSRLPSCAFSPDGKALVVERDAPGASWAVERSLWDVASAKEIRKWSLPHRGATRSFLFSPDGKAVAAWEGDEVDLWDAGTGKELPALRLPEGVRSVGSLHCLAFSPDGRTLAAGGDTGVIYLWEVSTARTRAVLTGHRDRVSSLDFSPDGARLISGSHDTTALIWDLTGVADEKGEKKLTPERLAALWDELADVDAGKACRADWRLASDPATSLPFLRKHVHPAEADPDLIAQLLAALDSNDFEERESATGRLAKLGDLAGPALRKALEGKPSDEARRRLEELVRLLDGPIREPEQARALRGVEVLEHVGSAEARRLLDDLAKGAPGAALTRDAKAALARLSRRKEGMP